MNRLARTVGPASRLMRASVRPLSTRATAHIPKPATADPMWGVTYGTSSDGIHRLPQVPVTAPLGVNDWTIWADAQNPVDALECEEIKNPSALDWVKYIAMAVVVVYATIPDMPVRTSTKFEVEWDARGRRVQHEQ
mmetsp:Transcript_25027/g.27732  ORF Transcript_25027/g.27732 Transcript_25027/m.27732 type:complete len:136 (-) Transcript_25027:149-556(-)